MDLYFNVTFARPFPRSNKEQPTPIDYTLFNSSLTIDIYPSIVVKLKESEHHQPNLVMALSL